MRPRLGHDGLHHGVLVAGRHHHEDDLPLLGNGHSKELPGILGAGALGVQNGAAVGSCAAGGPHHRVGVALIGNGHDQLIRCILHALILLHFHIRLRLRVAGNQIVHGRPPADAAQRQAHGNAGAGVGQVHGADQFLHQHLLARRRHHRQHHGLLRGLQTQIAQHLIAGSPTAQRRKHHRCAEGPVKIHKSLGAHHPVGNGDHQIQSLHMPSYASSMISSTCPTAGTGVRLLSLR